MKEPYEEGVANRLDPESCVVVREDGGEALAGARAGWVLSREITGSVQGADVVLGNGRPHRLGRYRESQSNPARSETPCMYGNSLRGSREVHWSPAPMARRVAKGRPRPQSDDERPGDVRQAHSTDEAAEQSRADGRGGGGGKEPGQGERGPAKRAPDTVPDKRAQCAGPRARSGDERFDARTRGRSPVR